MKNNNRIPIEHVAWVAKCLVENMEIGGTFRHPIYDIMGYDYDAYCPLWDAGLGDINYDNGIVPKLNETPNKKATD